MEDKRYTPMQFTCEMLNTDCSTLKVIGLIDVVMTDFGLTKREIAVVAAWFNAQYATEGSNT